MKASELILVLAEAIRLSGDTVVLIAAGDGKASPCSLEATIERCANDGHLVVIRRK